MKVKAPKSASVLIGSLEKTLPAGLETDRKTALKVLEIVEAVMKDPFEGIGKPEPLSISAPEFGQKQINTRTCIVYVVTNNRIDFVQCRYHYCN